MSVLQVIISKSGDTTELRLMNQGDCTMITKRVIDTLYKKYKKLPESPDCLDMPLLFETSAHHNVSIDMEGPVDSLIIRSVNPNSPFHRIPLEKINAIVPFEEWVAIVMHSSIIFLNKKDNRVSVNLKPVGDSFIDRLRQKLSN